MDRRDPVKQFMDLGWLRWLPPGWVEVLRSAVLGTRLWERSQPDDSAWDPDPEDDLEQEELTREHKARMNAIAHVLGLDQAETLGDTLEMMLRLGIVRRLDEDHIELIDPLPLPEDVIDLTPVEKAHEDDIRWTGLHYETSQQLIGLFTDTDISTLTTSLQSLAAQLDKDPESVRQGILILLDEGDFAASTDIEHATIDESFTLRVDWEKFAENRITIRFAKPDDQ